MSLIQLLTSSNLQRFKIKCVKRVCFYGFLMEIKFPHYSSSVYLEIDLHLNQYTTALLLEMTKVHFGPGDTTEINPLT